MESLHEKQETPLGHFIIRSVDVWSTFSQKDGKKSQAFSFKTDMFLFKNHSFSFEVINC